MLSLASPVTPKVGLYSPFMPAGLISHRIFMRTPLPPPARSTSHPATNIFDDGWLQAAAPILLLLVIALSVFGAVQSLLMLEETPAEVICSGVSDKGKRLSCYDQHARHVWPPRSRTGFAGR